ncbi:MAG: aldehyde-activating protein [Alcanivoracaceae bacterium]|nr:aldehyde-activating protein [Alcanivoracaceae bacterium]
MITAQCHCGNIQMIVETIPDTMTQCNCSICRRLAAQWLYFKATEVKIHCVQEKTKTYEWGDKDISFHHCPICGCSTHYTGTPNSGLDRTAINANMLSPHLIQNLKIRNFNGAEM